MFAGKSKSGARRRDAKNAERSGITCRKIRKLNSQMRELSGRPMRAKMNAVCGQELQSGVYMDSKDLAEKYRNNPERLESIMANAKRFLCPHREIGLYEDKNKPSCICPNCKFEIYEDRQYQSCHNAEESHTKNESTRL